MGKNPDPPEPSEDFFDGLSEAGRELSPVNYRYIVTRLMAAGAPARLAESRFYRANSFACWNYHKPISKVLPPDEG